VIIHSDNIAPVCERNLYFSQYIYLVTVTIQYVTNQWNGRKKFAGSDFDTGKGIFITRVVRPLADWRSEFRFLVAHGDRSQRHFSVQWTQKTEQYKYNKVAFGDADTLPVGSLMTSLDGGADRGEVFNIDTDTSC
jgi:hypothetical protein